MEIEITKLPYKHRFAAASVLMSKGDRLIELKSLSARPLDEKQKRRVLEGLSFYDMALFLMKPYDPNYQSLLNWKCLALISLGQYEDARKWYEELVRIAIESEGPNGLGPTARLAQDQIASLTGKLNESLPDVDEFDVREFDDPLFCLWAEQFCQLLQDRKFNQAHRCLSSELGSTITPTKLKSLWSRMLGSSLGETIVTLMRFEFASESGDEGHVGWCYLSVTNDDINEAISMDVYKTPSNAYELRSLVFGRP